MSGRGGRAAVLGILTIVGCGSRAIASDLPIAVDALPYTTFPELPADVNRDGVVNDDDVNPFLALVAATRVEEPQLAYRNDWSLANADLDLSNDKTIDLNDVAPFVDLLNAATGDLNGTAGALSHLLDAYHSDGVSPLASVPEPDVGALLALGLFAFACRRAG